MNDAYGEGRWGPVAVAAYRRTWQGETSWWCPEHAEAQRALDEGDTTTTHHEGATS